MTVAPLTFTQEEILLLDELSPPDSFVMATHFPLPGDVDDSVVAAALQTLVDRHDALRMTIDRDNGSIRQRVGEPYLIDVPRHAARAGGLPTDLPTLDPTTDRGIVSRIGETEVGLRLELFCHHVFLDGWSIAVLAREFYETYGALRGGVYQPIETPAGSFADYARDQRDRMDDRRRDRYLAFWHKELAGAEPFGLPQLAATGDAPPEGLNHYLAFTLPAPVVERLNRLAAEVQVTQGAVYLAAVAAMLHAETGSPDQLFVSFVADRIRRPTRDLVGFLLNPVAFRLRPGSHPQFRDLVRSGFRVLMRAMHHQVGPFQELLADPAIQSAVTPMVTYQFHAYMPGAGEDLTAGTGAPEMDLTEWPDEGDLHSVSDLDFEFFPAAEGRLTCRVMYRPTLWARDQMTALVDRCAAGFRRLADDPDSPIDRL